MHNAYDKRLAEELSGALEKISDEEYSECAKEEPEDERSRAFSSFVNDYQRFFEQLSPEWQDYMFRRDSSIARVFDKINQEKEAKKFLDEAFLQKGQRHGFKSARDWMEKLILAEELLEHDPKGTLSFLAKSYGVDLGVLPAEGASQNPHLNELKLAYLTDELQHLQQKLERRERREAALRASAVAAKRAKEAAFAPQGKKPAPADLSNLTTRQILERQFAALDD